jgi:hypothetical protein
VAAIRDRDRERDPWARLTDRHNLYHFSLLREAFT